jgi:hypothetical protein
MKAVFYVFLATIALSLVSGAQQFQRPHRFPQIPPRPVMQPQPSTYPQQPNYYPQPTYYPQPQQVYYQPTVAMSMTCVAPAISGTLSGPVAVGTPCTVVDGNGYQYAGTVQ